MVCRAQSGARGRWSQVRRARRSVASRVPRSHDTPSGSLAATLACMRANNDDRIKSATFFTSMVDFEEPGELGVFIDDDQLALIDEKMKDTGYLDGSEMASTFNMLRANDLIWSFVVNNYLMGKDPFPFDLLYWNSNSTRMPAASSLATASFA